MKGKKETKKQNATNWTKVCLLYAEWIKSGSV